MLLFSQVGWSRDSWWLLIIHSACSHCITDYLASIVCERGLTPPPQTQTSYIRELAGEKKNLVVTLREERFKPITSSHRTWSEGCCRASQRDWGRNYQGSLEEGAKEKLERFDTQLLFAQSPFLPSSGSALPLSRTLARAGTLSCSSFSFKTQTQVPRAKCFTNVCRKLLPAVSHFSLWWDSLS